MVAGGRQKWAQFQNEKTSQESAEVNLKLERLFFFFFPERSNEKLWLVCHGV